MQIGGKYIVKYVCEYGVETKTFKMTQIQNNTFPCLFILEWAKTIQVWYCDFQEKQNLAFQCQNLLYCIILFLISSLCISMKGWYTMFVGALFK